MERILKSKENLCSCGGFHQIWLPGTPRPRNNPTLIKVLRVNFYLEGRNQEQFDIESDIPKRGVYAVGEY